VITPKDQLTLPPYKGSTLRGGFGHVLKRVVCVDEKRLCRECLLKEKCVYAYVFETSPPRGSSLKRKYSLTPHPFVICPPLETKTEYEPGELLSFELILIGKAIEYLPYFIYAFDELGKIGIGKGKGKYELKEVKELNEKNEEKVLYQSENKTLVPPSPPIKSEYFLENNSTVSQVMLLFLTPLRLKEKGDLIVNLTFTLLIDRLLTRINLLSYFHCGGEGKEDYQGLLNQAEKVKVSKKSLRWHDWERYSQRQDTRMKLGGLLGSITFEGEITPFLPYLRVGQYIHVGQGTSFGLGRYEIYGVS